ncbi:unnamed protein product [Sphagnum jensenii]
MSHYVQAETQEDIARLLRTRGRIVITAPPCSGKTTELIRYAEERYPNGRFAVVCKNLDVGKYIIRLHWCIYNGFKPHEVMTARLLGKELEGEDVNEPMQREKQMPSKKIKTGKKINFLLIPEQDDKGNMPEPYKILKEVRDLHHGDIREARIALAWRLRTKADKDGHIVLGKCIKVGDLYREYADYDFIITLNKEFWEDAAVTKEQRVALIDHECCHAAPTYNGETGEHEVDERGRYLFRLRCHDLEEFHEVVERNGIWKRDIERFAQVLSDKRKAPMFAVSPSDSHDSPAIQ